MGEKWRCLLYSQYYEVELSLLEEGVLDFLKGKKEKKEKKNPTF